MKTFGELLQEKKEAIIKRWVDDAFATYPEDSFNLLKKQKDPFANPVGRSLRVGTRGILETLLEGDDTEKIGEYLEDIIKIRAVQQFTASQTVGFIFRLKDALRGELGKAARDERISAELTRFEGRIDQVVLDAFDIYAQAREKVHELRVNEVKRRVLWVVEKLNGRSGDPGVDPDHSEDNSSKDKNVRREDLL